MNPVWHNRRVFYCSLLRSLHNQVHFPGCCIYRKWYVMLTEAESRSSSSSSLMRLCVFKIAAYQRGSCQSLSCQCCQRALTPVSWPQSRPLTLRRRQSPVGSISVTQGWLGKTACVILFPCRSLATERCFVCSWLKYPQNKSMLLIKETASLSTSRWCTAKHIRFLISNYLKKQIKSLFFFLNLIFQIFISYFILMKNYEDIFSLK